MKPTRSLREREGKCSLADAYDKSPGVRCEVGPG